MPDPLPTEPAPEEIPELPTGATAAWQQWKAAPSPVTMSAALKHVQPTIDSAVRRFPKFNSAVLGGEAKRLAIAAIKSYNPDEQASLGTHVFNHLRPLARFTQESSRAISVPRAAREAYGRLATAERSYFEENNRWPNDHELQDELGISAKKLSSLRGLGSYEMAEGKLEGAPEAPKADPLVSLWTNYVYHGLSQRDKLIMDHKIGRNGREVLDTPKLAAKLQLHPTYINRRASEIAQQILDGINASRQPVVNDELQ